MRNNLIIILLFFQSFFLYAQEQEIELINLSFKKYNTNISDNRNPEAITYINSKTIKYYDYLLSTVKNADSVKISALNLFDKYAVIACKYNTPKDKILNFNKKSFLLGAVGNLSLKNGELGNVKIDGNSAVADFVMIKKDLTVPIYFEKENDIWKLNFLPFFKLGEKGLKEEAENYDLTENEFVLFLIKKGNYNAPKNNIWKPIE